MPAKDQAEYMRQRRAKARAEGIESVGHTPFADIKAAVQAKRADVSAEAAFEARWRAAGYTSWPPPWSEIIPRMTDEHIIDILDKMPTTPIRRRP